MDKLDEGIVNREELVKWCLFRQIKGFQGRPNKLEDVCYGFWVGASLDILESFDLVNHKSLKEFQAECHTKMGGFSKVPETYPDLLHSYMGVAVLSLMKEPGIEPIHSALNLPLSGYNHLKKHSVFWKQ